jgi:hypothetical protein
MRAPKVYLVSVLIATCTLLAGGYAQTADVNPESMVHQQRQALAEQPCKYGELSPIVYDSAKTALPSSGIHAGIPATPINTTPTVIVPAFKPEPITKYVYFESFFLMMAGDEREADNYDKAGKHTEAAQERMNFPNIVGFNDAEGEILREIVFDCNCAVKELDAKVNALADKERAKIAPGTTITIPAELIQMHEERKTIIKDHVEKLRVGLGTDSFNKLQTYILSMFHVEDLAEPVTSSTATDMKGQKERQ